MKKILLAAIIAGSLFACNRQDGVKPEHEINHDGVINLSIKQKALSKAVSDQKGAAEYAIIGSVRLFFIDGLGTSIYQRELTAAEVASITNDATSEGGHSITISGVPNSAETLYFLANVRTTAGTTYPIVDGTTSADARLRIDNLQADPLYVPMSGLSAAFVRVPGTNQFNTSVTISPIVARLEVGQITCQNENGAGTPNVTSDITKYKLSGVFVNMVRQSVKLDGTPYLVGSVLDIRSQLGWPTGWAEYFTSANTDFPYYVGGTPAAPIDWVDNSMVTYCNPTNSALSFYPDVTNGATDIDPTVTPKKAWAFQISPSNIVPGVADVPHIILRLTDVEYDFNPLGLPIQYVTVTKYKDQDGNPIMAFNRANVYRITNLIFTHNEATNKPYEQDISVTAVVTVAPWTINEIEPDWL